MEETLSEALDERVRVTAAGRTDAGVHASGQVVSFKTRGRLAPDELMRAGNARLPDDIQILGAEEAPASFDARRSALGRRYRYTIWNRPLPNLWQRYYTWHVPERLSVPAMNEAASLLVGRHDFGAFLGQAAREPASRSTVRVVTRSDWLKDGGHLYYDITADAFLRHMVRGIVGTLVWVGQGRLNVRQFEQILDSGDRRRAGPNAPAQGLMLVGVDYENEPLLGDSRQ